MTHIPTSDSAAPRRLRSRGFRASLLLFAILFAAPSCSLHAEPPRLVPPTVDEDASLPSIELSVLGRSRRIHLRISGDPGLPVLFVMPGSLSDLGAYLAFEAFADRYRVVIWDQRGQGLSERVPREELSFAAMVDEIRAMKATFSPDAPLVLLGHSWSAIFAALYAAAYPEDVSALILLEPFGFQAKALKEDAASVNLMTPGYLDMAWLSTLLPVDDHESLDFRMRGMLTSAVRPFFKDSENLPPWPVRRVGGLALLVWEAALYSGGVWDFDLSVGFERIECPVLLVGSQYSFIGYEFQRKWNEPLFPSASRLEVLRLADSGHRMITENWTGLEAGIDAFLGGLQ